MPSGSHGSSGGGHSGGSSHFGGGGHSGGSSHFGGSSGGARDIPSYNSRAYRNTHRHYHCGRPYIFISNHHGGYYQSEGSLRAYSVLAFFIPLLIFATIVLSAMCSSCAGMVNTIKEDYSYYKNMITVAETRHNEYLVTGNVISYQYYEGAPNKYRLRYSFEYNGVEVSNGITFYTYTEAEAQSLVGETIQLAIYPESNFNIDSIDVAFKNTSIEDDGEYAYQMKRTNMFRMLQIISIILCVADVVAVLVLMFSSRKKSIETEKVASSTSTATKTTTSSKRYCKYCGSPISAGSSKCSQCGSTDIGID